jgi:hypothetical protein
MDRSTAPESSFRAAPLAARFAEAFFAGRYPAQRTRPDQSDELRSDPATFASLPFTTQNVVDG